LVVYGVNINEAFESKYGLPVVRERIGYLQLLKDIRAKKVKEIHWFSREDDFYFEGPCIIEYHDSSVKQSVVPPYDYRIPSAMSSSGVKGTLLSPVPTKFDLSPIPTVSDEILNFVGRFFPLLSLIGVYLGVQYMNWLKGDYDDRKTAKKGERRRSKAKRRHLAGGEGSRGRVYGRYGVHCEGDHPRNERDGDKI